MSELVVGRVLGWLTAYTYPIVFAGVLIDATGVPFPGRLLLAGAGALAGSGRRSVILIIVLGAIAAVLVDHVWYLAGKRLHGRLGRLYRRLTGRGASDFEAARDYFTRYGAATIVVGRFFTSVRVVAWPVAAANGVGYLTFLALDLAAATIWVSLWVLLGWIVGDRWESAAQSAGFWLAIAGGVFLTVAAAPLAVRIYRRSRAPRPSGAPRLNP